MYSSSHPLPRHLPFLSRLNLKTIVALTPKDPIKTVPAIEEWLQDNQIRLEWIKIAAWKDEGAGAVTKEVAEQALSVSLSRPLGTILMYLRPRLTYLLALSYSQLILSEQAQPLLLIALTPQPTSLILSLLRLTQGYTVESILPEVNRTLRAGLEGDAEEDDKEDCEKWLRGWIGKDLHLSMKRSEVVDWTWPKGTLMRWLREFELPLDRAIRPQAKRLDSNAPDGASDGQASSSNRAMHRSATLAITPRASGDLQSGHQHQIQHPFLKLKFLPEAMEPPHTSAEVAATLAAGGASSKTIIRPGSVPPVVNGSLPIQDAADQPVSLVRAGRKRSLTISEGGSAGQLAHQINSDAAAAAAISSSDIDLDGTGMMGLKILPNGDTTSSITNNAATNVRAERPKQSPSTPVYSRATPDHRWGNAGSLRQHRQCFPDEHIGSSSSHSAGPDEEDEDEHSTPRANGRAAFQLSEALSSSPSPRQLATGADSSPPTNQAHTSQSKSSRDGSPPPSWASSRGSPKLSSSPTRSGSRSQNKAVMMLSDSETDGVQTPTKARLSAASDSRRKMATGEAIESSPLRDEQAGQQQNSQLDYQSDDLRSDMEQSEHYEDDDDHGDQHDDDEEEEEEEEDDEEDDEQVSEGLDALDLA